MKSDDLIPLAEFLGGRIHKGDCFNPNVGQWTRGLMRARVRGYRISVRPSESLVEIDVSGFDTPFAFSVNLPDRVCLMNKRLDLQPPGLRARVFVGTLGPDAAVPWLRAPMHSSLLAVLDLRDTESVQVYRNGIALVGLPDRATPATIQRVCDLADALRVETPMSLVDGMSFDASTVPPELRVLEGFVRLFAVGDDERRGELLDEASPETLDQLLRLAKPLLPAINAFLDSFGDRALSSEAILLGSLAEAVSGLAHAGPEDQS